MKVKPAHYAELKSMVVNVLTTNKAIAPLGARDLPKAERIVFIKALWPTTMAHWLQVYADAELTEKRARWDLLWRAPLAKRIGITRSLYEYCNDDHIDTALRNIVKELLDNESKVA